MADNKIKISADTKEIRKSLLELSKDVKKIGDSKVGIFSKEDRDYLKAGAKTALENIRKQMESNRKELTNALKEQSKTNKTVVEEYKARQKIHDIMKKQIALQKQMQQAQELEGFATGGISGFLKRMKGGAGGSLSKLGVGGALRMLGPMGMAAGAGAFLYGRGRRSYSTFQGGINDRLMLRGRQVGDMGLEDERRAERAGLNAQTMRRARLGAMDVFGRAGSTQQAVMQRAEFERNFGIQQGTMAGIGGQMRGTLGGRGANRAVMTIQASLIASGITDEIGPYLETAAQMLTDMNEKGITFSDSATALLSAVAGGGAIAPERAGRLIGGIDQAIRGSTGEANAFFQQVFAGAGIGGGNLGGIQAAMRSGGLFGANIEQNYMTDVDRRAFQTMGIGGRTMGGVAQSTMKNLDTLFGSESLIDKMLKNPKTAQAGAARRLQRNQFIMETFGLQNEVQASEVNRLLKDAADPRTSAEKQLKIQEKIKGMQKGTTELGNLQKINESTAAVADILANKTITTQDKMGEQLAPMFTRIDGVMVKLDASLIAIMDFFGVKTGADKLKPGLTGQEAITKDVFEQATMGDPQQRLAFSKQLGETYKANQKELQVLQKEADAAAGGSGRGKYYHLSGAKAFKMRSLMSAQTNIEESFSSVPGLDATAGLGKAGAMKMSSSMIDKAKKQQEAIQKDATSNIFDKFISDMKSIFVAPQAQQSPELLEAVKEIVKESKNNVKATQQSTKAIESTNGAPAKTGRT